MMDRLSGLPDDVVCHILSFLPTKTSARTSTLSKGWRFHWAHVPCSTAKTTGDLVNTFLIGSSNDEFDSWITTVFTGNVRDLVVGLNHPLLTLPRRLFACESLVYLRIHDCGSIPGAVSFPALKKLELVNVGYDSFNPIHGLLSGCPVLEELTIERLENVICCDVSSPSLTRLVIDAEKAVIVHLRTPSLRYLHICDRTCKSTSVVARPPMTSLIEANVDLINAGTKFANVYDLITSTAAARKFAAIDDLFMTHAAVRKFYSLSVIKFVQELYNVECLKLSTCSMDANNVSFSDLVVKFRNLTQLSLSTDWRFITSFLENANNLRVLKILRMVDHITQRWIEPEQVPECLASHLETVSLVDFGWCAEHEFDMVKYILKNGKVLKKVEIICTKHYQLDSNVKREAIKRISMFEMSQTCQLTFVSFI